ncbi:MAG: hypothetical protein ACLR8Y_09135 [Alistipes indistinctus]
MYRDYIQPRHDLSSLHLFCALNGHLTGMPILRVDARYIPTTATWTTWFSSMFGDNLLIGVFSDSIYPPRATWIDFGPANVRWRGEGARFGTRFRQPGRAGFGKRDAILPMQKPVQYIGERPLDTLILKVYPSGNSSYTPL